MTFEQPSVDKRAYRHCKVSPAAASKEGSSDNYMDVLLISDPETDKASAAMDVHAGQLCDSLPGIAHFCEHMLFIGTKKYPTENAYDQFLSTHGGSSNAFTDLEHTCYYFDVQATELEGAFDRFAQCFIGPLFTQSALEREVQAVDSERHKNLQQDPWRMYQLSKTLLAGSKHPFGSFGSGNQESLPNEDIRDELLKFYEKYYRKSLCLYKLVILGKESLDDLEAMVHRYFDDLTTSLPQEAPPRHEILKDFFPPVDQWQVPQRVHIVPVSQIHALELQFPLPPQLEFWKSKPTRYLSHLIGHEGEGSLLSLLKEKDYALELYADDSSKSCLEWNIFTTRLELTDLGMENVDQVMEIVFAYIALLKEEPPKEWIQTELQTVGDLQFKFLSQRSPMDYTCGVAGWMQHYPPSHYLSGPYKVLGWDAEAVTTCLNALHPDNVFMMVSSPTYATSLTNPQTEQWYGTQYQTVPIDDGLKAKWKGVQPAQYPALRLPDVNDMIATDFDLLPEGLRASVPVDAPQCILLEGGTNSSSAVFELWYKPDNIYEMPKVNMLFSFQSRLACISPQAAVALRLFVEIIQEEVNEFTYLASMASLHCDVSLASNGGGIDLQVTGYNHKAHVLVEKLIDVMLKYVTNEESSNGAERPKIDGELFQRIGYKVEQQFQSFLVAQPYQHAIYGADQALEEGKFTYEEKMATLKQLSSKSVLDYANTAWKDCRLKALVHGNVTPDHAKELTQSIWKKVLSKRTADGASGNLGLAAPLEQRVVQLAPGSSYLYRFEEFNPSNTNSCCQIVLQVGLMELAENATLAFCHHLIREPAFNQLRTEEQLGYIVHTSIKTSGDNVKGLLFLIQSDSFDPIHVEGRVEAFLSRFRERIRTMTAEEFETNVTAVVASFLEKNKNLGEESSRYWHVMMNGSYSFRRLQDVAEEVKSITKERVLVFFDKYIAASGPCRRKLCVQVFAKQHHEKMAEPVEDGIVVIQDPAEFKQSMSLYPLPKKVDFEVVDIAM